MISIRQIEANRRNSQKSTGPRTEEGKGRSRRNAVRHGLTAETVIGTLEDPGDYKAFELAVTSDFDAQTAVERELVLRLASLLWRLRRALAVETGLLQIQSDVQSQVKQESKFLSSEVHDSMPIPRSANFFSSSGPISRDHSDLVSGEQTIRRCQWLELNVQVARCFLRLNNVDNGAFERLSRYEAALWRQVTQILFTIDYLGRRSRRSCSLSTPPGRKAGAPRPFKNRSAKFIAGMPVNNDAAGTC